MRRNVMVEKGNALTFMLTLHSLVHKGEGFLIDELINTSSYNTGLFPVNFLFIGE